MILISALTGVFLVFIVLIGLYARRADRLRAKDSLTEAPHDRH
jgi:hypothetical protein